MLHSFLKGGRLLGQRRELALSAVCILPLAITIPWVAMGTVSIGRAILLAGVGIILLLLSARVHVWLPWWIAPALLPGIYAMLLGWVDLRVIFPLMFLWVLMFACALGGLAWPYRKWAMLLSTVIIACGIALGFVPVTAFLVLLAFPLVVRVAWSEGLPLSERILAYVVTVLLLWIAYLIQGIVR